MFSVFLWWSKKPHFYMNFSQNNYFLHQNINVTLYFQCFLHCIKIYYLYHTFNNKLLRILKTCSLCTSKIYQPKIKCEDGVSYFYKNHKYRRRKKEKNKSFSYFNSEIPNFSYIGFFRKCSTFCQSIPLKIRPCASKNIAPKQMTLQLFLNTPLFYSSKHSAYGHTAYSVQILEHTEHIV